MSAGNVARASSYTIARKIFVIGAIGFLVAPAIAAFGRRLAKRQTRQQEVPDETDARVDKNLKDTFPASDPPAPHFVDIPVNRR